MVKNSKNIIDSLQIISCTEVYNSINCMYSNNLIHCFECDNSNNLIGCTRCSDCSYCYESSNQVNKKYMIKNKQVTKEEYEQFLNNKITA